MEELAAPPPPPSPAPPREDRGRWSALALGLLAATLFVALATVRLGAQGPQYDELHQATGAFTWLGSPPELFCLDAFNRVCLLNTTYSGAIKTNLYGLYLRLSGGRFDLGTWRLAGIFLLALGIALFPLLARRGLPLWSLAVFLALLLSDAAVLLFGRFDWGPVSLALALRLAFLGLWLRSVDDPQPSPWTSFGLGALGGLATFEKLSSCLLVLPLGLFLLVDGRRRTRRHGLAALAGLAAGAAPLALVNLGALLTGKGLISLRNVSEPVSRSVPGFAAYLGELASLGQGGRIAEIVLGLPVWRREAGWEAVLLLAAVLGVAGAALLGRCRPAGIALASYGAVAVGLYFLPRATSYHHWILATPFQYAALVLALVCLARATPSRRQRGLAIALTVIVTVWVGIRVPNLIAVERAFVRGSASRSWSPALARLGSFAARQADQAVFVAADWGVATQIYCFANGRPGLVYEPYWHALEATDLRADLRSIQAKSGRRLVYLVRLEPAADVIPGARARVEAALLSDPYWLEVPVEPEARLPGVRIRKLLAVELPGRPGPAIPIGPEMREPSTGGEKITGSPP